MIGVACSYRDRRGRACPTAWCPTHRAPLAGPVLCRRHAGIVTALGASGALPPDLETRAPSLLEWVSRGVDVGIAAALNVVADPQLEQLVTVPGRLIFLGVERHRAWERAWQLAAHTGLTRRVSLVVEEADDSQVVIRVGQTIAGRLTPPWIEQRRRGESVSPEEDAKRRQQFDETILELVRKGLAAEGKPR